MRQVFIGITGLQATGKSHVAERISEHFKITHVRTDAIREFLIQNVKEYAMADYSNHNPLIAKVNSIVARMRDALVEELLSQGHSVILDSCGSTKEKRAQRFGHAPKGVTTVLIHVIAPEKDIRERLAQRDKEKNTSWLTTYNIHWEKLFEAPTHDEADYVFTITSNDITILVEKLKQVL